jgi:hypothetical protein
VVLEPLAPVMDFGETVRTVRSLVEEALLASDWVLAHRLDPHIRLSSKYEPS